MTANTVSYRQDRSGHLLSTLRIWKDREDGENCGTLCNLLRNNRASPGRATLGKFLSFYAAGNYFLGSCE